VLVKKIEAHFGNSLKGKVIAVWGLAFKPKTDDMREAPAIPIIEALLAKGVKIQVYDPEAMKVAKTIFGSKISYSAKNYDALKNADALAVVTEWQEFREPDFARIKKLMRTPIVFDGRNIYQPDQMKALGFTYISIGR
jgi:UDPglucose 6-dehydrogenase